MKPPVELHRPTILNIVAIICYCLAIMFHIIAFATDNWSSLLLDGVRWRMGLWHGCRQHVNDTSWHCGTEVFEDKAFQTGSDWHIGSRIMMVLALISLFILEFVIIGYACIKRLERYKSALVGLIIGLSLTSAFSHFLVLIMYGTEVQKIPDSEVKASYGIIVICFFLEIAIPIVIQLDKCKRFPISNSFIATGLNKLKPRSKSDSADATRSQGRTNARGRPYEIEDRSSKMPPASVRTSVSSLSEVETYKKFAYLEDPAGSHGSSPSVFTQSTAVTNLSYVNDERGSVEMGV